MTTKPTWSLSEYFLNHQNRIEARRRRNRIILIGFSLLVMTVVGLGSMFYLLVMTDFVRSIDTASGEPQPAFPVQTTMQAYDLALASAQAWKEDATLLKATATWTVETDSELILDGSETWSFGFYSPGNRRAANISVIDGTPTMMNSRRLGSSIEPSAVDGWTIDSDIAILRMLDEGGQAFLDKNEIGSLTMALTAGAERGRPEWLISVFSAAKYYNMRLDASNGEVLDAYSSS